MTWQSVWQQGRGKVTQFNRNTIQPNQPLQNQANATIWLVLWSQPIWFNRRLVTCFVSDIHDIAKCMRVCSKEKEGWYNAWFISTLLNLWSVFPLDNSPTLLWSQPSESFERMATAHCMTLGMYLVSYPPAFPNVCCLPKTSFFWDSHVLSQLQQFGFLLQTSLSSLFVVVIFFFFDLLSFAVWPFTHSLSLSCDCKMFSLPVPSCTLVR